MLLTCGNQTGSRRPTILSIDPFERCQPDNLNPQGNYEQYIENIKANGVEDRCMALAAFSADAARTVPGGIGVLVVDGSHHYDAVKKDLELYLPKVVTGLCFSRRLRPGLPGRDPRD